MNYETEQTMLFYCETSNNEEIKQTFPLIDISYLINTETNSVCLWLDAKLDNLGSKLKRFCLDVTNDPKTDNKFCITNLGYYSIRFTGQDCEIYHINNKTLFKFPIDKFNIHYNLSLYLPLIGGKNFREQFMFDEKDNLMFVRLEFRNNVNYDINTIIYKQGYMTEFRMNLLEIEIENNYKDKIKEKIDIENLLSELKLI